MPHDNKIIDTEAHFIIDPETRSITNGSAGNNTIVQHDHNSERFTFEMPRYVDGHDMIECTDLRIHYTNTDSTKWLTADGVYIPDDLSISPDDKNTLVFSWLLSSATTQHIGHLYFSIQFVCIEGDTVEYAWNTGIYKDVKVIESINNTEVIVEQYPDVLEQWRQELFEAGGDAVVNVNTATENALSAIEAKGVETIDSIPDDYTELVQAVDENREGVDKNREDIIKTSEIVSQNSKRITNILQGLPDDSFLTDSTAAYKKNVPANALPYAEVTKIGGLSKKCDNLISYPFYSGSPTRNGVTFTDNKNGTITINGTATSSFSYTFMSNKTIAAGTYTMSVDGGVPNGVAIYFRSNTSGVDNYQVISDSVAKKTFTLANDYHNLQMWINPETVFDNCTLKLMLNTGSTAKPFEPYFEGLGHAKVTAIKSVGTKESIFPIPAKVQDLDGYGWGVNKNCYNYVTWRPDDTMTFNKRIGKVDLGSLNWKYGKPFVTAGPDGFYVIDSIKDAKHPNSDTLPNILTEPYSAQTASDLSHEVVNKGINLFTHSGSNKLVAIDPNYTDLASFKAAMQGVVLYYELDTPETIDISHLITSDNLIEVEGGGTITFENDILGAVPSEVTYQLKGVTV